MGWVKGFYSGRGFFSFVLAGKTFPEIQTGVAIEACEQAFSEPAGSVSC